MSKQLRLVAGYKVVTSSASNKVKEQLLKFIKEDATDCQIKALLMDGRIVQLDEQAEEIVNDRFAVSYSHLNESGMFLQILAKMTGILPLWRKLAGLFSDAHRKCGLEKISKDRDACLAKARLGFSLKKIEIIKKAMADCKHVSDPPKCQMVMKDQLEKEKAKAKKYQEKLNKEIAKGNTPGEEPAPIVATRN